MFQSASGKRCFHREWHHPMAKSSIFGFLEHRFKFSCFFLNKKNGYWMVKICIRCADVEMIPVSKIFSKYCIFLPDSWFSRNCTFWQSCKLAWAKNTGFVLTKVSKRKKNKKVLFLEVPSGGADDVLSFSYLKFWLAKQEKVILQKRCFLVMLVIFEGKCFTCWNHSRQPVWNFCAVGIHKDEKKKGSYINVTFSSHLSRIFFGTFPDTIIVAVWNKKKRASSKVFFVVFS